MSSSRHFWVAVGCGFTASALLFYCSYATHSAVLDWPQIVGLWLCWAVLGIHSVTETDYALIAMPINGAIYAVIILLGLRVFGQPKAK